MQVEFACTHEWHLHVLIDHDASHVGWRVYCDRCETEVQWDSKDLPLGTVLPTFAR